VYKETLNSDKHHFFQNGLQTLFSQSFVVVAILHPFSVSSCWTGARRRMLLLDLATMWWEKNICMLAISVVGILLSFQPFFCFLIWEIVVSDEKAYCPPCCHVSPANCAKETNLVYC
jgi:hypothetical protein